jgi:hypothetical protein
LRFCAGVVFTLFVFFCAALRCPAEYWLHPARFRTQMCKKGNQCNRTLCFFAHSASELRFPDTEDEAEAAAVDAAAASATAAPLPLYSASMGTNSNNNSCTIPTVQGLAFMQSVAGNSNNSLPLMHIGSVCSDASAATAAMNTLDGSSSSYSLAALQAAAGMRQGSCASQLTGLVDDMSGSYGLGGSDPGMILQQAQQQHQQGAHGGSDSLSEPLRRLDSDPSTAAWLQLATASQLPASQILSSIRPPAAATVAAQQQQLQQRQMLQHAAGAAHRSAAPLANGGMMAANGGMMMFIGGGGNGSGNLARVPPRMDSSAEQLVASLGGLQLQGGVLDDRSNGSLSSAANGYAGVGLAAAAGQRPVDASLLQLQGMNAAAGQGVGSSSRVEDFLLLQLLQEKQVQQQQQQQAAARLSTGGHGMGARQGMQAGQYNQQAAPAPTAQQRGKLNWNFSFGL